MIVHRQVFSAVARAAIILFAGTSIMASAQTHSVGEIGAHRLPEL